MQRIFFAKACREFSSLSFLLLCVSCDLSHSSGGIYREDLKVFRLHGVGIGVSSRLRRILEIKRRRGECYDVLILIVVMNRILLPYLSEQLMVTYGKKDLVEDLIFGLQNHRERDAVIIIIIMLVILILILIVSVILLLIVFPLSSHSPFPFLSSFFSLSKSRLRRDGIHLPLNWVFIASCLHFVFRRILLGVSHCSG